MDGFPLQTGYILHDIQCNFNTLHRTCYSSYQNCSCYYLKRPDIQSEDESSVKGLALKEEVIGGKVAQVKGEEKAVARVNYFRGEDASQWKSNISTYEVVNLGEVYEGIDLLTWVQTRKDAKICQHGKSSTEPHPRDENLRYIRSTSLR